VDGFTEKTGIEFLHADNILNGSSSIAIDLPNDINPVGMREEFHRIHTIRAQGPLISDQFRYALSCGFDEVEIDAEIAARQPESHWNLGGESDDSDVVNYRDKLSNPPQRDVVNEDVFHQKVIDVHHYSDTLFRFKITRPDS